MKYFCYFFLGDPELRNFQSVIICTYIFSIFFTTLVIVILYNVKVDFKPEDPVEGSEFFVSISESTCQHLGFCLYFSGILMFCWMSILCFDLFWTFACTPATSLQNRNNQTRQKKIYVYKSSLFTDLGHGGMMIICQSILISFIASDVFRGGWGSSKYWIQLKIELP